MPARSKAQQRLMGAAEHGANFPMARKLRASMTHQQLHDFASGPMKGKPAHVTAKAPKGKSDGDEDDKPKAPKAPKPKYETEITGYDWRQRHGLKRGRD